ncbi:hypothetical protein F0562_013235 [Nyssa sinensis]|uniref:Uncharacterized protein n=1 Tax=Nyssa sinensis TaxID=561372 RepID=A0A5J4ZWY1_9ASTE|nr:hypothetical protein F0562_013235 [Nyssa sinensis]
MDDSPITTANLNTHPDGVSDPQTPYSNGSLFHIQSKFHLAKNPFTGFSNGSKDFRLKTLNPSLEPQKHGSNRDLVAPVGKKPDRSDFLDNELDRELSSGIVFRRIRDGDFRGQGRTSRPGLTRCFLNYGTFQRSALCRCHRDEFIARLDDLSMNYCSQYNCSDPRLRICSSGEKFRAGSIRETQATTSALSPSSVVSDSIATYPDRDLIKQIRSHEVAIVELRNIFSSRAVYQKNGNLFSHTTIQKTTTATALLKEVQLTLLPSMAAPSSLVHQITG